MTDEQQISDLVARRAILLERLRIRQEQQAKHGIDVPPAILFDIREAQAQLEEIADQLRRLQPATAPARAPYPGLQIFGEADADRFFGRDALLSELREKIQHAPFLALLGASGSGKSSLVLAGLLPQLRKGGLPGSDDWRYVVMRPGARPLDAMAAALATALAADVATLYAALDTNQRALLLHAQTVRGAQADRRLLLLVDQAEELWSAAPAEPEARALFLKQRDSLLQQILTAVAAADSPILVILTLRADFLDRAIEQAELARWLNAHSHFMSPMTAAELHRAIEDPLKETNLRFEAGLVDELVEQVSTREQALPLLAYTLLELWNACKDQGLISWQAYHALGGAIESALAKNATALLATYNPAQQAQLRAILLRLVQPGDQGAVTRRRVPLDDLVPDAGGAELVQALVEPLVRARLLTIDGADQATRQPATLEIAHESLMRAWPQLRQWIEEAREDLRFQLRLEAAAQEWVAQAEQPDYLWNGALLARAEEWRSRASPQLSPREQRFLDAGHAAERRRQADEAAAQAAHLAAQQLRQVIGAAAGAGLGYGLAFVYTLLAASAGPLLLRPWSVSWDILPFIFVLYLALGQALGLGISVGMLLPARSLLQRVALTVAIGAAVGCVSFLLPALFFETPKDRSGLGALLPYLQPGALLGAGLGLGACAAGPAWRRLAAIVAAGGLAGGLAHMVGEFAPGLPSALIGGCIIGGVAAAGLLLPLRLGRPPELAREAAQ